MPKKFVGENSKATAARSRKAATKEAETAKKQKDAEDSYWKDNDKQIQKKLQRKEESERKKQQILDKKVEMKALLEKEMNEVKSAKQQPTKITRAQITVDINKRNEPAKIIKPKTHIEQPLDENLNRDQPEQVANTIDEAIAMLSVSDNTDDEKHPEKRLKAAYLAFEEKNLQRLKSENPTLRLSQLKQLLFKEWSKSNENPLNKAK